MFYPNYEMILIKYILVDSRSSLPLFCLSSLRYLVRIHARSCHVMEYIRYRDMITGRRKSESHITLGDSSLET